MQNSTHLGLKLWKHKTVEFENQHMKLDGPSIDYKLTTDLCQSKLQPNCSNKVSGLLKGNSGQKNELSSIERAWKMQNKEPSLTSMHQMVDIPSQSQEFKQDGFLNFVGF